jgi:hypothetical protein
VNVYDLAVRQEITEGFTVWSRTIRDANDEPVGGVVLDVVDLVDTETGERQRAFVTIDPYRTRPRLSFHRLAEADVAGDAIELPEPSRCAALARRLCEEVAIDGHKRRTGLLEPRHAEYVVFAHRLVGVVMGGM